MSIKMEEMQKEITNIPPHLSKTLLCIIIHIHDYVFYCM